MLSAMVGEAHVHTRLRKYSFKSQRNIFADVAGFRRRSHWEGRWASLFQFRPQERLGSSVFLAVTIMPICVLPFWPRERRADAARLSLSQSLPPPRILL
eukprot:845208-Rhodomonas_salina.5